MSAIKIFDDTYNLIRVQIPTRNPETHKYIGAVSFHSWRGCDDVTLRKWAVAAKEINVLLLVGEGSSDAAAHGYVERCG